MTRKEFLSQVGTGAALLLLPMCIFGLESCKKKKTTETKVTSVDFTLDISTGALANNGGSLIKQAIIVARTNTGAFLAVDAACTHAGSSINYQVASNSFQCPNHGATFAANGNVTQGPATSALKTYQTELSGNNLRVFS